MRQSAADPCYVFESDGYIVRVWAVASTPVMQGDPHVGAVGPPRFLVRGWRVAALPSRRVIPVSGLGDPFDALCADGRRPLPPWWVIRMSGLRVPLDGLCLDGGASTPVRLGDPDVGPG